jgi:hypothetical protein
VHIELVGGGVLGVAQWAKQRAEVDGGGRRLAAHRAAGVQHGCSPAMEVSAADWATVGGQGAGLA